MKLYGFSSSVSISCRLDKEENNNEPEINKICNFFSNKKYSRELKLERKKKPKLKLHN